MKSKSGFYKLLCLAGFLLSMVVITFHSMGLLPRNLYIMLHGFCSCIFIIGLIFTIRNALEGHDPAMRKLRTIEDQDERNILIRRQAAAVSGNVLQWLLMIAALICIGLGAPIWIGFLMIGLSLLKLGVEFCLSIYYGDKL